MKPSWDSAPEWANYLAMDANGEWFWYESEPVRHTTTPHNGVKWAVSRLWESAEGRLLWAGVSSFDRYDWEMSLEVRPRDCVAVTAGKPSWDAAPEWAKYVAQAPDGRWFWYEEKPSMTYKGKNEGNWYKRVSTNHAHPVKTTPPACFTLERRPRVD